MDKLEVDLEVTKLDLNEILFDSIQIELIAMMLMPPKTKSQKLVLSNENFSIEFTLGIEWFVNLAFFSESK